MLAYVEEGKGAPLILIHGFGVGVPIWERLAPLLRESFRLIQVELPGIGGSAALAPQRDYFEQCAREIEELRLWFGLERLDIVSYSMGTRAAEFYQRTNPEHVHSLIYLCPAVLRAPAIQLLRLGDWVDGFWPGLPNWILSGWLMAPFILGFGFSFIPSRDLVVWKRHIVRQSPDALKAMLRGVLYTGSRPIESPDAPHLFVWALTDLAISRPKRPGERDRMITASHNMPLARPHEVASLITTFFAREGTACA